LHEFAASFAPLPPLVDVNVPPCSPTPDSLFYHPFAQGFSARSAGFFFEFFCGKCGTKVVVFFLNDGDNFLFEILFKASVCVALLGFYPVNSLLLQTFHQTMKLSNAQIQSLARFFVSELVLLHLT
jgi:hypothetical protein